jgi:acetolactate synthase-like protein
MIINIQELRIFLGPVFVEFPIDVLYPFHLVEREVGIKPNAKTLLDKLANLFVKKGK